MTMEERNIISDAVGNVLARPKDKNHIEITLSNGIVLELRPVPPALRDAVRNELVTKRPKVPIVHIESKDRDEENPGDPAYLEAMNNALRVEELAMEDLSMAAGTIIVSVPDDMLPLDGDDWMHDPRIEVAVSAGLRLDVSDNNKRRIAYLRFYALETHMDFFIHKHASLKVQGISEEEIRAALESFRGIQGRISDIGNSLASASTNGS